MNREQVKTGEMREMWRWVVGFENLYMVSNSGRVLSVPRIQTRRGSSYLKPGFEIIGHDNGRGYMFVALSRNGKTHQRLVHRLVAEAFIPNPDHLPQVNHKDGNKSNNLVTNLEWVTAKENSRHAIDVLGHDYGKSNRLFSAQEVEAIRSDTRPGRLIALDFGVSQPTIDDIKSGRTYTSFPGRVRNISHERERKLTQAQANEIRNSDKSGVELSKIYKVARSTICKIRKGYRYKEDSYD